MMIEIGIGEKKINGTTKNLKLTTIEVKTESIDEGSFWYKSICPHVEMVNSHFYGICDSITIGIGLDLPGNTNTIDNEDISDEAIREGFELYFTVLFCPVEGIQLYKFHEKLVTWQSAPTIIQTTVNNIGASSVKSSINLKSVNKFYKVIEDMFQLQLGKIVIAQSSQSELRILFSRRLPYLDRFGGEVEECTERDECEDLHRLVETLSGEVPAVSGIGKIWAGSHH